MSRDILLDNWLRRVLPGRDFSINPASSDASFRRYYRVAFEGKTRIAMDAPPEHEDCRPFIHVARVFLAAGVHVPEILEQDLEQGFLLLTDLGSTTYLNELAPHTASPLYLDAVDTLLRIQLASRPGEFPEYDRALLLREMQLFPDWYIEKHVQKSLTTSQAESLHATFELILRNIESQPKVYVHRDYHSRNLMVSDPNPGVLDFQDAVHGAITYDLASLFKDAYISWDEEQVLDWVIRYWEKAKKAHLPVAGDFGEFYRDFEWMGVQRHIKVLGIFARLFHRDGKEGYLKDMPLVMHYLRKACERYAALHPLLKLLDDLEDRAAQVGYTF